MIARMDNDTDKRSTNAARGAVAIGEPDMHNGWTNYETWRTHLEMFDGYEPTARTVDELAAELESFADEIVDMEAPEPKNGYSFTRGIVGAFLHAVNWAEIAEHIIRENE